MVEFGTVDLYFNSSGDWSSDWSYLMDSWWVEELEINTLSNILIVQSKLKVDTN
jgi:hypothetical protein